MSLKLVFRSVLLAFMGVVLCLLALQTQSAAAVPLGNTYIVGGTVDGIGTCNIGVGGYVCPTLRAAVMAANAHPDSTIQLAHGATYTLTVTPAGNDDASTGDLNLTANVTFGFVPGICLSNCRATIAGKSGWLDRLVTIQSGVRVVMGNVNFRNGRSGAGGAIYNSGTLTLTNSLISDNSVTQAGGGLFNDGTLILTACDVTRNDALSGGGLNNIGTLTMTDSTLSVNGANVGGGLYNGDTGAAFLTTVAVFSNSVVNTNDAGGGINNAGVLLLDRVLLDHNEADALSGLGGGLFNRGTARLISTGLTNNTAGLGGGIYNRASGDLALDTLNLTGNAALYGAGLYHTATLPMTLTNVALIGNYALIDGGGLYSSAAAGPVQIDRAWFEGNQATTGSGGGAYLSYTSGHATFDHTTFFTNTAPNASGYTGGGAIYANSTVYLSNSTLNDNSTGRDGGAIKSNNGFIYAVNTTLSDNHATRNGGGLIGSSGDFRLFNVTVAGNSAGSQGGGLFTENMLLGAGKLRNSLLGGNSAPTGPDCAGTYYSTGHNLVQSTAGCILVTSGVGDLLNVYPFLDGLKDNGGLTLTRALLEHSAAINAGDPDGCVDIYLAPLTSDQRGANRVGRCDIGAYEYGGLTVHLYLPAVRR